MFASKRRPASTQAVSRKVVLRCSTVPGLRFCDSQGEDYSDRLRLDGCDPQKGIARFAGETPGCNVHEPAIAAFCFFARAFV
jgi:hypothetical protein